MLAHTVPARAKLVSAMAGVLPARPGAAVPSGRNEHPWLFPHHSARG
jgi:hypothetical protein